MTVVTMVVRLDAFSLLYGVLVAILLPCNRRICYILWPVHIIMLTVLLAVQYLSCLGLPPALCLGKTELLFSPRAPLLRLGSGLSESWCHRHCRCGGGGGGPPLLSGKKL